LSPAQSPPLVKIPIRLCPPIVKLLNPALSR
jgi:hypothetical protein